MAKSVISIVRISRTNITINVTTTLSAIGGNDDVLCLDSESS